MRFERDDAKIGVLVIAAIVVFGALLFHRSIAAAVKKENVVRVQLEDVSDVQVGTEVQLQGYRVGQVNQIDIQREGDQYTFLATLGLRTDIVLWKGTKGVVSSKGLGGAFLDLELPPPEKRGRGNLLGAGDILPSEAGTSLGTLINEAQAFVQNLNESLMELKQHLKEKGLGAVLDHPEVHKILESLNAALVEFRKVAKDSRALVKEGSGSVQSLDKSLASLEKTMATLQTTVEKGSGNIEAILTNLASVLKEIQSLSGELQKVVKTSGPEVDANLKTLHRDLQALEELIEILKAKPNRVIWGTPTKAEQEAARKRVEAGEKKDEPQSVPETPAAP